MGKFSSSRSEAHRSQQMFRGAFGLPEEGASAEEVKDFRKSRGLPPVGKATSPPLKMAGADQRKAVAEKRRPAIRAGKRSSSLLADQENAPIVARGATKTKFGG